MSTPAQRAMTGMSILGVATLGAAAGAYALSDVDPDRTVLTFCLAAAGVLKIHAAWAFPRSRASAVWSYLLGNLFLAAATMYLPHGYGIIAVPFIVATSFAMLTSYLTAFRLVDVAVREPLSQGLKNLPRIAAVQLLLPFLLVIPVVSVGARIGAAAFWRETVRTGAAPIGLVFGGMRRIPAGLRYLLPTELLTITSFALVGLAVATVEGRDVLVMISAALIYVALIPGAFLATRFAYYAHVLGEDDKPAEGVLARGGRLANAHPVETSLAVAFGRLAALPTFLIFVGLLAKPLAIWRGIEEYRDIENTQMRGGAAILAVWWLVLVPAANLVLAHVYLQTEPAKLPGAAGTPLAGWLAVFSIIGLLASFAFAGQYSRDTDTGVMMAAAAVVALVVALLMDASTGTDGHATV